MIGGGDARCWRVDITMIDGVTPNLVEGVCKLRVVLVIFTDDM